MSNSPERPMIRLLREVLKLTGEIVMTASAVTGLLFLVTGDVRLAITVLGLATSSTLLAAAADYIVGVRPK